ncbi:MAG TPA: class I SAM-dependent methyltransferase [Longimicrobium sp.]|nr:class I SAM-dependent methyltransferase [Longimicrobium sp.]
MSSKDDRPPSGVRGEYARLAARYDERWVEYNLRSLDLLRPHLADRDAGTLLDQGCGTANLVPRLAEWGTRVQRYHGADLSAEMLRAAAPRVRAAPFPAALLAANAAALPLRTASIDTIVSASTLHDWDDPRGALAEARRVLRPGGRLLLLDWSRQRVTMRALNLALRITRNPFHRMYSRDEAEALLTAAGFRVVSAERRPITWMWELMVIEAVASGAA